MKENIAEILGLLCSEGYYRDSYIDCREYDKRRKKYYSRKGKRQRILEFCNKNIQLVHHFQKLLEIEFYYSTKISITHVDLYRIFITRWDIIDELTKYSDFGCSRWRVPKEIIHGSVKIKKSFIKGFFYGDGCLDKTKNNSIRLRLTSTNFKGIESISKILSDLKIMNNLNGPYIRKNRLPIFEILIKKESNQKFINNILDKKYKAGSIDLCRDRKYYFFPNA